MTSVARFSLLLLVVGTFFLLGDVTADNCIAVEGLKGCACRMSNSSKVISLQELVGNNTSGNPIRFNDIKGDASWKYAYHPCGAFDMFLGETNTNPGYYACKQATVGRYADISVKQCEGLGNPSHTEFEYRETFDFPIVSHVTVTFLNVSSDHGARISLVCNSSLTKEQTEFKYLNVTEGTPEYYHFSLTGPCSCPGGCKFTKPLPANTGVLLNPHFVLIATLSLVCALLKL